MLRRGDLLTPSRVGSIAALGMAEVSVYDRPRVGLVSTGQRDRRAGDGRSEREQIYDINRFTLGAVVSEHGGVPIPCPITADSLPALGAAVDDIIAQGTDILVFSGGSSVGERDLTLDVMREKGSVAFHGIAVKPGKPTAFGHIGATPVLGMPGYPTSCLSNAYLLLVPFLRRVARLPPHRVRTVTVPAAHRFVSTPGRHQFYTVRIVDGPRGRRVQGLPATSTSMSQADGYVEIPAADRRDRGRRAGRGSPLRPRAAGLRLRTCVTSCRGGGPIPAPARRPCAGRRRARSAGTPPRNSRAVCSR